MANIVGSIVTGIGDVVRSMLLLLFGMIGLVYLVVSALFPSSEPVRLKTPRPAATVPLTEMSVVAAPIQYNQD
jgi:hypothetical protein